MVSVKKVDDRTAFLDISGAFYAFDDLDLSFTSVEVDFFIQQWNEGKAIFEIHRDMPSPYRRDKEFKREFDEVALLCYALARKELIQPRKNGLFS